MASQLVEKPFIFVLAGVNGAGKSSLGGHLLNQHGLIWYNPDDFARELMQCSQLTQQEANGKAWEYGRSKLEEAIKLKTNYAFETTLGGNTITSLLINASKTHDVIIWFCGLSSAAQHIARVKARVMYGGHAIPEDKIKTRWTTSRINLIKLLPHIHHLQVFDNSLEVKENTEIPEPTLLLEIQQSEILLPRQGNDELSDTPDWVKPIIQAALELT